MILFFEICVLKGSNIALVLYSRIIRNGSLWYIARNLIPCLGPGCLRCRSNTKSPTLYLLRGFSPCISLFLSLDNIWQTFWARVKCFTWSDMLSQSPKNSLTFLGFKLEICQPSSLHRVKYGFFEIIVLYALVYSSYLLILPMPPKYKCLNLWNYQHLCGESVQTFITYRKLPRNLVPRFLTFFGLCVHKNHEKLHLPTYPGRNSYEAGGGERTEEDWGQVGKEAEEYEKGGEKAVLGKD